MGPLSFVDYIGGVGVFAGIAGALAAASAVVLRRRLGHLRGAPRALALGVLGLCGLVGIHLIPGALGILSRWSVLACAVAALLAAVCLERRPAPRPDPSPPSSGRDGPLSWVVASIAVTAVGVFLLGEAWEGMARPSTGDDSLTFHLPNVAAWIQDGTFWRIDQFTPLQANGNYPQNGDVIFLAAILPWRNDAFTNLVNPPLVAMSAVAVYAIARELGAPRATAIALAAAFAALPVLALTVNDGAYTDPMMLATFGAGVLFLLRHLRTRRRSELVIAGLGLGLAFGTKWYAVTAVLAVLLVWVICSVAAGRGARTVAREGGALATLVLLAGGFWLLRNGVESGNPVMPIKVELLGATIFDAARDVRDCVGFSIAHYLDSPDAWRDFIIPGYRHFLSLPGALIALSAAATVVLAARTRTARETLSDASRTPVLLLAACAALISLVYLFTPYTALGLEGQPVAAGGNTRYLLPALLVAAPIGACAAVGRRRLRAAIELLALAAVFEGLRQGYDLSAFTLAAVTVAASTIGAAGYAAMVAVRRLPGRGAVAAATALGVLGMATAIAVGHVRQREFNDDRYRGSEPSVDWILKHAPSGRRVGLAGVWDSKGLVPVLPAFGPRLENRVSYVGKYVRGLLHEYEDRERFLVAVRRARYDLLIVGNDDYPERCRLPGADRQESAWARSAGFEQVAHSGRLSLYRVPPGRQGSGG